ncbi:hypothetical protein [Colwellia sp. UCD-KL20]|uniref:hypothetical protein n=1 Tax=Colwellia sp. UCD-KL20 TaxID=1917165 RepID=UPI000971285E|nr:hypothetical protein [Colwellia sp. UCD-KL20]
MLKKLIVGSVLLSTSLFSQAGIISNINGADMSGIQVTAMFGNGNSETLTWAATGATSGGVTGAGWSLSLTGDTFGDYDGALNTFVGDWVLSNDSLSVGIVGLEVNAGVAGVYFDDADTIEYTAGSNVGRPFAADSLDVNASFSDIFSAPDLFGTMNIDWKPTTFLDLGQKLTFLTDTDKSVVSEPATALVFLSGLLALVNIRRKS